jgi:hypothetical protein
MIADTGGAITLAATTGLARGFDSEVTYLEGENGLTPWVAKTGSVLRIKNCGSEQELKRIDPKLRWNGKAREIHSREGGLSAFSCRARTGSLGQDSRRAASERQARSP